ncbi:hypothetical protein D3C86_1904690 [compost metagenome]
MFGEPTLINEPRTRATSLGQYSVRRELLQVHGFVALVEGRGAHPGIFDRTEIGADKASVGKDIGHDDEIKLIILQFCQ